MRSGKTDGRFSVAIHGVESTISYKSITSMPGWYVIVELANQDISVCDCNVAIPLFQE